MAYRPNTRGRKLLILIGDGASPEAFAHPCWINGDRGIAREARVSEELDFDCDEPDLPGWVTRVVDGKAATVSGAGKIKLADQQMFDEWFASGEARNVRVLVDTGAEDAPMYEGAFKLSALDLRGGESGSLTGAITLLSHGQFLPIGSDVVSLDLGDHMLSGFNFFYGAM